MAWTPRLTDRLSQSNAGEPVWIVEVMAAPFLTGLIVSATTSQNVAANFNVMAQGVTIPGEGVDPLTWNTTHGAWSFEFVGAGNTTANYFRRGRIVRLMLGFADFAPGDYGSVAVGIVQQIESVGPNRFRVSVTGLGGMLGSRLDPAADVSSLFYNLPGSTTLTLDYTASSETTLTVSSTSGMERETGGNYLVQVVPSTGSPFYLFASSITATTITLVANGGTPPPAAQPALNTTPVDAVIGDTVNFIAYVAGDHPVNIALKVLTSTGNGTNGPYDTLPKSWGIAIPQTLIDFADVAKARATVDPTAWTGSAVLLATDAQPDPGSWLSTWLATMGIFITMRQGDITIRAADVIPFGFQQSGIDVGEWIERDGVVSHVWYDPTYPTEAIRSRTIDEAVSASNTRQEAPSNTLPSVDFYDYTGIPTYSNITNCLIEVNERIGPWSTRIPERLEVVTSGWYCAQLGPGDGARLTTDRTQSQFGLNGREVTVLEVSPVLTSDSFSTRLTLSILPPTAN